MSRDYALFTDDAARILLAWTNGESDFRTLDARWIGAGWSFNGILGPRERPSLAGCKRGDVEGEG